MFQMLSDDWLDCRRQGQLPHPPFSPSLFQPLFSASLFSPPGKFTAALQYTSSLLELSFLCGMRHCSSDACLPATSCPALQLSCAALQYAGSQQ